MAQVSRVIPRIVVIVEGGVVTDVLSDTPLDVEVIDYDIDGHDRSDDVIKTEAGEAIVYSGEVFSPDIKPLDGIWDSIQRMRKSR